MKKLSFVCKRIAPPILGSVAVLLAMCYIGLELLPALGKFPAFLCLGGIFVLGTIYIRSVLQLNARQEARSAEAEAQPDTRDPEAIRREAALELHLFWVWYAAFILMAALLALLCGATHKVDTWFTFFALISFIMLWGFFAWLVPVGLNTDKLDILTEAEHPALHQLLREVFPGERLMLIRDRNKSIGAQEVGKSIVVYAGASVLEQLTAEELKQVLLQERVRIQLLRSTRVGEIAQLLNFRMKPTNISPLLFASALLMAPGISRLTSFFNAAKGTVAALAEEQAAALIAAEGSPEALASAQAKLEAL